MLKIRSERISARSNISGLSRPLVILEDYDRFQGELVKVSTKSLIDGRRRFNGRLKGVVEDHLIDIDTAADLSKFLLMRLKAPSLIHQNGS